MSSFGSSPFEVMFPYEFDSPETIAVKSKLREESNIRLECKVTAGSEIQKTNIFTLDVQEMNRLRVSEHLIFFI